MSLLMRPDFSISLLQLCQLLLLSLLLLLLVFSIFFTLTGILPIVLS
jgi:hypothetical protein